MFFFVENRYRTITTAAAGCFATSTAQRGSFVPEFSAVGHAVGSTEEFVFCKICVCGAGEGLTTGPRLFPLIHVIQCSTEIIIVNISLVIKEVITRCRSPLK